MWADFLTDVTAKDCFRLFEDSGLLFGKFLLFLTDKGCAVFAVDGILFRRLRTAVIFCRKFSIGCCAVML